MRLRAILAAFLLVTAPTLLAPAAAFADGIERPRPQRQRPPRRQPPPPLPPAPVPLPIAETGPEVVTLDSSFFASGGGVGSDIAVGGSYSSTTVIIRGSSASAFASSHASAGSRGSGHGGGCGCR